MNHMNIIRSRVTSCDLTGQPMRRGGGFSARVLPLGFMQSRPIPALKQLGLTFGRLQYPLRKEIRGKKKNSELCLGEMEAGLES